MKLAAPVASYWRMVEAGDAGSLVAGRPVGLDARARCGRRCRAVLGL
jgi:hypothetical protein